jgi:N-methylhydantoinase A
VRALVEQAFATAYRARYSRPPPKVPIDLVHARIVLRGPPAAMGSVAAATPAGTGNPVRGERQARFAEGAMPSKIYDRAALPAGFAAGGPALVEEAGSTLVVGPDGRFRVLQSGNILVEVG